VYWNGLEGSYFCRRLQSCERSESPFSPGNLPIDKNVGRRGLSNSAIIARLERRLKRSHRLKGLAELSFQPVPVHVRGRRLCEEIQRRRKDRQVDICFAAIAIGISCLGILGLASYMAEQRTREIASGSIGCNGGCSMALLSKDFVCLS